MSLCTGLNKTRFKLNSGSRCLCTFS